MTQGYSSVPRDTRQSSVPRDIRQSSVPRDTRQSVSLGTLALAESIQHTSYGLSCDMIHHHASIMYMLHAQANDISVEHSKYCPTFCSFESILLCIAHAATTNKDFVTTDNMVKIHLHQMMTTTATTLHLAAKVWRSTCPHHRHRLHHQHHQ